MIIAPDGDQDPFHTLILHEMGETIGQTSSHWVQGRMVKAPGRGTMHLADQGLQGPTIIVHWGLVHDPKGKYFLLPFFLFWSIKVIWYLFFRTLCEFLLCFSIFNSSKNCNRLDSKCTLIAYIGSLIISYFFPWFSILSGICVSCGNLFMTCSPSDNRTYGTSNKNTFEETINLTLPPSYYGSRWTIAILHPSC